MLLELNLEKPQMLQNAASVNKKGRICLEGPKKFNEDIVLLQKATQKLQAVVQKTHFHFVHTHEKSEYAQII